MVRSRTAFVTRSRVSGFGVAATYPRTVRLTVLEPAEWRPLEAAHAGRVDRLVAPHLERRARGERHPVEDFLFTYYSLRPAQLRRRHPGAGAGPREAAEGVAR